jgi:Methionyl-tRNA formyltransferase
MRVSFYVLGQKGYASLRAFVSQFGAHPVAYVVSARDLGVDKDWYAEIRGLCQDSGIDFFDRGASDLVPADFGFAIGWKWLIRDCSNLVIFHDSLLPKYRGFAPLVGMLIDGVTEIGVTALVASGEYDRGDIVHQQSISIQYPIKIADAISRIIPLYVALVLRTAEDLFSKGRLVGKSQDDRDATYSLWRDERDYFIDWSDEAARIRRFVDALGSP